MATIETLLEYLALYGGKIVSTSELGTRDIQQAQVSGRMYVNENSLGFVWMPNVYKFPITVKDVELFEKWFPLNVELPEELKKPPFIEFPNYGG